MHDALQLPAEMSECEVKEQNHACTHALVMNRERIVSVALSWTLVVNQSHGCNSVSQTMLCCAFLQSMLP
jgi:hypothetical protein